jgi:ubiquitin carboxyl-terminal hydrolase 48
MYKNGHILSFADELCNEKKGTQHTEGGFRGTLLTSNVSSQVV